MEKSAASLLDVDTPTDAALLVRHPACPDELREMPAWQDILADRIEPLMRLVTTPDKELVVAGRGTYVCERCQPRPRTPRRASPPARS